MTSPISRNEDYFMLAKNKLLAFLAILTAPILDLFAKPALFFKHYVTVDIVEKSLTKS